MKKFILLLSSLLLTTCTNSAVAPTCDSEGTALNHQVIEGNAGTASGAAYHISLQVDGTPITAIADTGSSNLILQSGVISPSGASIGNFQIQYGSGLDSLTAYRGNVTLDCLSVGVDNFEYGIVQPGSKNNVSILGLAFKSKIESVPVGDPPYKTFMTQLSKNNAGVADELSLLLCGYGNSNSRIYFGGIPNSASALAFQYTPIVEKSWYVINATQIGIGGNNGEITTSFGNLSGYNASVILDSGTTLNLLPQAIVDPIVSYLSSNYPNAADWNQIQGQLGPQQTTAIACPSSSTLQQLPPILIQLDNVTLSISPQTYFKKIENGQCFFGFGYAGTVDINNPIILGQVTLENYFVRFVRSPSANGQNGSIGFASNAACSN